jgi:predicted phage terminase large subunit-like protein
VRAVLDLHNRWKVHYILVEDAASGVSLVQELRQKTRLPIIPVKVVGDKRARAEPVTPEFESGRVFLPKEAPWREEFEYEMEAFPLGEHDDIVDSVVQYLTWARGKSPAPSIRPFWLPI